MTPEQFDQGIKVLQNALRKKYSEDSYKLFWSEVQEVNGNGFLIACRELSRTCLRLPSLAELLAALPQEYEERPAVTQENLWLDKVREVYNRFNGLSDPERRELLARFNAEDSNLFSEAVVLYEKIWPQVCQEYPDWSAEQKAHECLKRYIGKRHRDATPQEMIGGVVGYDGKIYKWPTWYSKRFYAHTEGDELTQNN